MRDVYLEVVGLETGTPARCVMDTSVLESGFMSEAKEAVRAKKALQQVKSVSLGQLPGETQQQIMQEGGTMRYGVFL